ncbi:MAG: [protein-PII] uridylyltransferase [Pseudomonadota bacterium]
MSTPDAAPPRSAVERYNEWFDSREPDYRIEAGDNPLPVYKQFLEQSQQRLKQKFDGGISAPELLKARSWLVDRVLQHNWQRIMGEHASEATLVAVGGYGRSELMPGSDIDLMLLIPAPDNAELNQCLEQLLMFLWDIGLEVGHSVRTVEDCIEQSLADITVITNLMESRRLAGNADLYQRMRTAIRSDELWPSRKFFEAKYTEQQQRHHKYHDTAYKLEPNVKESPGGLRDIQVIAWVANRHFGTDSLEGLVEYGFLTDDEYHTLVEGRNFLWEVRFALHTLTGRGEDRLLFDYQRTLAGQFGFRDDETRLGVEAFMKQYYQTIMELSRLNEMLLQLFQEKILFPEGPGEIIPLNNRFQSRNGFIETTHKNTFENYSYALLEIFLLLEQHPEISGVRADTIRAIRKHCRLIDDDFRNDIRARSLFMEIIRQPQGVTHELRRMNVYGVLAAYLPAFGKITGLMQYDLFHAYTVDEHILFVVRNLRRFSVPEFADEFPLCSHVVSTIPKPELLYIAGLYHDIAKGRGGDHSKLGSRDVREFCERHDLSKYDTGLVSWLVENHLLMSSVAQRQDISDPVVINHFARQVTDSIRLDYLYLLTVADIRGTNPELWNTWKDALLKQLYHGTRRALQRGLEDPLERAEHIQQIQNDARKLLEADSAFEVKPATVWGHLGEDYFLRHTAEQVARHTRLLAGRQDTETTIVSIQPVTERGGTEILIYTPSDDGLFTLITAILDQLGLNVVDAGIITTDDDYLLDTFHVLDTSDEPVQGDMRIDEIRSALVREINSEDRKDWHVSRRPPRQHRHFPIKTHITFKHDDADQRTVMELITADQPGLLSQVGRAFSECRIRLQNARITTLGARAEDVYYITDRNNRPLSDPQQIECLEQAIRRHLDSGAEHEP